MSRQSDEPMTGRGNPAAPASVSPHSHDAPAPVTVPRAAVPLPLVAHVVARLVGGQKTSASEIPNLVESVSAALEQILYPTQPLPVVEPGEEGEVAEARPRRPRRPRSAAHEPD